MTMDNRVFAVTRDINDNSPGHNSSDPYYNIIHIMTLTTLIPMVGNVGAIGGRFRREKGKKRFNVEQGTRRFNEIERRVSAVRLHRL